MEFLKVLWENLRKGPVTDPFPFGETFTPERLRGKVEIDPSRCVGCGTCKHVCAAGAINITRLPDDSGFDVTVWHNSCCLCAQCRHYCPTKAITVTNDWHSAHRAEEKYTRITRARVKYQYCANCGAQMRFLPQDVLEKIYADHPEVDLDLISHLCPACRQLDCVVSEQFDPNTGEPLITCPSVPDSAKKKTREAVASESQETVTAPAPDEPVKQPEPKPVDQPEETSATESVVVAESPVIPETTVPMDAAPIAEPAPVVLPPEDEQVAVEPLAPAVETAPAESPLMSESSEKVESSKARKQSAAEAEEAAPQTTETAISVVESASPEEVEVSEVQEKAPKSASSAALSKTEKSEKKPAKAQKSVKSGSKPAKASKAGSAKK